MRLDSNITVDRESDLTVLGAHSIGQLQLASRLSSLLQHRITVKMVVEHPVISQLASSVDEAVRER
jgi:hypothetical protein